MKRFSKITACLLAVLMLAGFVFAIAPSAASDNNAQLALQIDGVTQPTYSGGSTNVTYSDMEDGAGLNGWSSSASYYNKGTLLTKDATFGTNPNKYIKIYSDGSKVATSNSLYMDQRFANSGHADHGFMYDDFIVSDFEMMADSYVVGSKLVPATDVAKDAEGYAVWAEGNSLNYTAGEFVMDGENKILYENLKLSYLEGYAFGSVGTTVYKKGSTSSKIYAGASTQIAYDEATNSWSVNWGGVKVNLSATPGVFDHFTVLIKIDNSVNYTVQDGEGTKVLENQKFDAEICYALMENPGVPFTKNEVVYTDFTLNISNTRIYYYFNGEYIADLAVFGDTFDSADKGKILYTNWVNTKTVAENLAAYERNEADCYIMRHQLFHSSNASAGAGTTNYHVKLFSMGYDNVALNYYTDGYAGELATHDLTTAIYNVNDVVYKGTYKGVNAPTGIASVWSDEEGGFVAYDANSNFSVAKGAVDYAIANAGNNVVAVISSDVTDYRPAGENLPAKFFVKCENGAKFTLASGCGYYLLDELDANGCYVAEKSQEVNVFWFLSEDDFANVEPAAEGVLLVGDSYEYAGSDFEAVDTYLGDGKTKAFIGWKYAVHLEGEFKFFEGDVITSEIYDEVQAAADAGLEAVLIVMPAYEIKEAYFSITKDEDTTFYYTAEDMMTALDGITGVNTVVLYKDVIVTPDSSKWVAIPGSGTFNIDVNGHTLGMKAAASSATGYRFFRVASGKDYNFYSTAPGGKILINSGRLIDGNGGTNDTQGCIVNIGTIEGIEGANGANLQLHVGQLMFSSPCNRAITENVLTIKDTVLFVTHRVAGVRCPWTVNIDNSTIVANDSQSSTAYSLFRAQGDYGALDISITNSTILSVSEGSAKFSIFNTNTASSVITAKISNTTIAENDMFIDMETEGATIEIDLAADVTLQLNGALADGAVAIPEGYKLVRVSLDGITKNGLTILDANGVIRNIDVVGSNTNYGYKIVPEATEVVTANGVLANITTGNGFWVNFYVPTSLGLEIVGEANGTTVIGGVEYAVYTVKGISPTSVKAATISFKAMTVGEVDYYKTISVSLPEYFTAVIAAEGATEAEKALAVNGANYCNELYKISKSSGYSVYNEIVEANADLLVATPALESVGTVTDTTAVSGATLMIGDGNVPMFAFTKAGEAVVTVKYVDIYGNEQTVTCEVVSVTTTVAGEEGEEPTEVTVEYYVVKEMHVYDMIGTIVVYADGEEALTYSIADYINALKAEETPDEKSIAVAEALYGYAKAVIAFKKS